MRVVHLASGDLWAGAEVQLFELCRAMQQIDGLEVRVILLNEGLLAERLRDVSIDVKVIPESQLSGLDIVRRLIRLLKATMPDVVHTHRQKENVLGSIAATIAGARVGVRTVHGAPEFSNRGLRRKLNHALDRWTARWLQHAMIMVTTELAEKMAGVYPIRKVRVIENGIAPTAPGRASTNQFRVDGKINVCLAGRLVDVKRPDIFLGIAREAKRAEDRRFHFHVFGDGPLSEALDEQIRRDGTGDIVSRWGFVDGLAAALAEMDALAMTSNHEGLPMVMLEAMAARVAVLAHAVGGMPDVLDEGAAGLLVNEHTADAFYRALTSLADPNDRLALAECAYRRFAERYTAEGCAARTVALYRELTAH
ncbi:MAG: glycosyltransferase family 4 protein [Pseudomonadota bacterium]